MYFRKLKTDQKNQVTGVGYRPLNAGQGGPRFCQNTKIITSILGYSGLIL